MNKAILFLSFIFLFSTQVEAKGVVPICTSCEYIQLVQDLPDIEAFQLETGEYLDLGYKYKQFWVVWVPFWNFEGEYCLMNPADDETFYELSQEDLDFLASDHNVTFKSNPISFWNKIGGKLVGGALLGLIAWGYIARDDDEEEISTEESA